MLNDDREHKEELPEEKNHMVRMSNMNTVWGEMDLAAPNVIEEDTMPPVIPSWPFSLLNQNLILNFIQIPSQSLNTSLPLLLTSPFDTRQRRDLVLSPDGNDYPPPVISLSSSFSYSLTL